jgi:cysteine desulfuration protein SufE
MIFYFDIPPESPTVRGYAAVLGEGLRGASPSEIVNLPTDFYQQMGLHAVLTGQRLRGIGAILAYMKRLAARKMNNGHS